MKRIIFTNNEGGISILVPSPDCGLTIEQIAEKDVPKGKEYKIVNTSEVPTDRSFRNAWEADPVKKIKVNMTKAIEIQKDKLRAERKPLLEELDTEFMRALEAGDEVKQAQVVQEKQRLRDITKVDSLLNANTPEELKSISILK